MFNFFVYADGCDLELCEPVLVEAFSAFAASSSIDAVVVNDKRAHTPDLQPSDFPE